MDEFIDWIKSYLETEFGQDSDIVKNVSVELSHKQANEITTTNTPQIQIQIMDNAEVENYSSFDGEHVSSIPLQLTIYTSQLKIKGIQTSAQESSVILGQKLKQILNKLRVGVVNENILRCRIVTMSPALPLLEGSKVYTTAVRCEFWIANPYNIIKGE